MYRDCLSGMRAAAKLPTTICECIALLLIASVTVSSSSNVVYENLSLGLPREVNSFDGDITYFVLEIETFIDIVRLVVEPCVGNPDIYVVHDSSALDGKVPSINFYSWSGVQAGGAIEVLEIYAAHGKYLIAVVSSAAVTDMAKTGIHATRSEVHYMISAHIYDAALDLSIEEHRKKARDNGFIQLHNLDLHSGFLELRWSGVELSSRVDTDGIAGAYRMFYDVHDRGVAPSSWMQTECGMFRARKGIDLRMVGLTQAGGKMYSGTATLGPGSRGNMLTSTVAYRHPGHATYFLLHSFQTPLEDIHQLVLGRRTARERTQGGTWTYYTFLLRHTAVFTLRLVPVEGETDLYLAADHLPFHDLYEVGWLVPLSTGEEHVRYVLTAGSYYVGVFAPVEAAYWLEATGREVASPSYFRMGDQWRFEVNEALVFVDQAIVPGSQARVTGLDGKVTFWSLLGWLAKFMFEVMVN